MDLSRYEEEAPAPTEPTLAETVRFLFDEIARRAYHSTSGLTPEQVNTDPGHGSWSIGSILSHQLRLVVMIIRTLDPAALEGLAAPDIGTEGHWNLDAIVTHRETLNERFRTVFARTGAASLMETRPELPPERWAQWSVLQRTLRPLADLATHVGQVNYIRRQLGNPVGRY